uniref:C-type lectin domain-containing protein n=1 Tax=Scophthalmus maximus TaxID=52904 RepID=A0A8D3DSE7_SCOMX
QDKYLLLLLLLLTIKINEQTTQILILLLPVGSLYERHRVVAESQKSQKTIISSSSCFFPQQYHLMDGSRTWSDARSFCRVKYTDLATVNNMDDGRRLVDALGSRVTHTWIGLRRAGGDRWMWSDGSGTAHFTKWLDGEPNNSGGDEQCGEFDVTWNDVIDCSSKKIKATVCHIQKD